MELKAADYAKLPRDSRRERETAQQLRQWSEEERYEFVKELLGHDELAGLRMASSTLQQKGHFEGILERGLRTADASSVSHWLECVVPKLGFRKVVLIMSSKVETDFETVKKALYWLPRHRPQNDPRADAALSALKTKVRDVEIVKDRGRNEMVFLGNDLDSTPRSHKQNVTTNV